MSSRPEYDPTGAEPPRERYGPPGGRPSPFERGTDGPKVVLAGVDGSVTSLRAAAYAAGLARRQRSELVVVFVASPAAYAGLAPTLLAGPVRETLREVGADLREQLRAAAEEYGVPLTFQTRTGDPYTELRAAADEARADMVVVGASTQAGHRLVGSIAAKLVRAGHWPVVVVP